jgi:hypothetical protein
MSDKEQRALVTSVEKQIAALLADLEKHTGCYVDGLALHKIEVTTMSSPAPEYLRRVEVDLRQAPARIRYALNQQLCTRPTQGGLRA